MAAIYQNKVKCSSCGELVPKTATRVLNPFDHEKSFQCYSCFKNKKTSPLTQFDDSGEVKREFFCVFCKYKFKSTKMVCPYCGKSENLAETNVKMVDILN